MCGGEQGVEVLRIASEREGVEEAIKAELVANPQSPGNFYPFATPVQPGTKLFDLLQRHK